MTGVICIPKVLLTNRCFCPLHKWMHKYRVQGQRWRSILTFFSKQPQAINGLICLRVHNQIDTLNIQIIYVHEIPYDTCMYHVTPNKGQFILMMKTLKILASFFTKKYMLYSINCHSPVQQNPRPLNSISTQSSTYQPTFAHSFLNLNPLITTVIF